MQPDVNQIKNDLSNKLPKSPTNWEPWTAEEQAAARERIGLEKHYELIDTIKIDADDITEIIRDVEPDGTPYNFESILINITSFNVNMDCLPRIVCAHRTDDHKFDSNYTASVFLMTYNDTYCFCESRNGVWLLYSIISHTNGVARAVYAQPDYRNLDKKTITGVYFSLDSAFINGTEIKIYGVRA